METCWKLLWDISCLFCWRYQFNAASCSPDGIALGFPQKPFLDPEGSPFQVPAERGVGIPLGSMEGIPMFCLNIKKTFQIHQSVSIFPSLKLPWIGASQFSDRLADWPVLAGLLRLDAEVERLRGRKASRAHIVSTPKTRGITSKCTARTCMQMYANVVYVRPSWYTHQCYWELSQALVSFFFFRGPCFRVMCFSKRPIAKIGTTHDTIFEGWFEATRGHKVGVACWPKGPFAESWWLLLL